MNRNADFFENGNNLVTNIGAGYVKVSMYDRVYAVLVGNNAAASLAFLQALTSGASGAKAAKTNRVWYRIGAPSSSNNFTLVESADGIETVNSTSIPALSATASNPFTVIAELDLHRGSVDTNNGFVWVNAALATFLILSGSRYPSEIPVNPLAA